MIMRVEAYTGLLFVWALLVVPNHTAAENSYDYSVKVDRDLERITVISRMKTVDPFLYADGKYARLLLLDAVYCGNREPLRPVGRRMRLRLDPDNSTCIEYRIGLGRLPAMDRDGKLDIDNARNRLAPPADWLWLPRITNDTRVTVSFDLPDGFNVSAPWERISPGHYRISHGRQSSRAVVALGDFHTGDIHVKGAILRTAVIRGRHGAAIEKLLYWIKTRAGDLVLPYGRFPHPSPQIVIVPVSPGATRSGEAVPFGHVIRDAGEAVQFFVDPGRPLEQFLGDWTATHEFSHLMLPYISTRQKWISEGFASYYQNVLLARAGVYTADTAWKKLYRGFAVAEAKAGYMTPNSTVNHEFRDARMMIYWSGAAIALQADIQLRDRTGNRESLDSVLGKFQHCCLPSSRTWKGREWFEKLDELSLTPVFVELYDTYADKKGMPDFHRMYKQLGIKTDGDLINTIDTASHVWLRRVIMSGAGQQFSLTEEKAQRKS